MIFETRSLRYVFYVSCTELNGYWRIWYSIAPEYPHMLWQVLPLQPLLYFYPSIHSFFDPWLFFIHKKKLSQKGSLNDIKLWILHFWLFQKVIEFFERSNEDHISERSSKSLKLSQTNLCQIIISFPESDSIQQKLNFPGKIELIDTSNSIVIDSKQSAFLAKMIILFLFLFNHTMTSYLKKTTSYSILDPINMPEIVLPNKLCHLHKYFLKRLIQ